MVDNIQGSEYLANTQLQKQTLEALLNSKRVQTNNPYSSLPSILDETDISSEAIDLFNKDSEIDYYTGILKNMPDIDADKVAAIKALYDNGEYELPSDEELASALLNDFDFTSLLEL